MSGERLIHSRLGVEFWAGRVPSIEAVRPPRCGVCGVASQCPGQPLTVVGHGVRERQQRGPSEVGAVPGEVTIMQRRFRCRSCGAVMVVAPAQVLRYRLFSVGAIVWALSLFGCDGLSPRRVRERVSPWRVVGAAAARSWQALREWVRAAEAGLLLRLWPLGAGSPRQVAAGAVWALTAQAPPSARDGSTAHQAVSGALHALMGITP
jgi:hypothetical protein